ncbi:MAG: TPM domain-containing protein [Ignavibacteriales bacterium]|nr:TPM domain-containing protein [Ignavibacteriales bacterium]
MKNNLIYNFFTDDDLLRISDKIKEMEDITSGEIRVSVKEHRKLLQRKKSVHELALAEFIRLKMHETRDKTGILIIILLEERKFHILADEGINEKVPDNTWDDISNEMQTEFQKGLFSEGIILGVEKVGKILQVHFPIKADDTNELSNKVEF